MTIALRAMLTHIGRTTVLGMFAPSHCTSAEQAKRCREASEIIPVIFDTSSHRSCRRISRITIFKLVTPVSKFNGLGATVCQKQSLVNIGSAHIIQVVGK